ncbi:MAG: hypothetical protein IAE77_07575 [Prosthecobacter sp.]|jgi:hypothetical protein|uniref:hypothetical protein n=1 Tax=Prosthecobacter sp. TaxID=1965333 RepID=UPI0019F5C771|nr:hypothetical protein [Prosthecobacter sp.]MBE2283306.1 hypothetical protein [Prosthecobacter sp.]
MSRLLVIFALIASVVPSMAALPGADALAKLIAKEFDTNADEKIDAGEWQTGVADGFTQLDSSADGSIQTDEVYDLKGDIAEESGDIAALLIVELIKQVLTGLDTDKDKAVSRKEYDELSQSIFGRLDADKNSHLTLAELAELPLKMVAK